MGLGTVNRAAVHTVPFQGVTMRFERSTRASHLPQNDDRPGQRSLSRGDGFAGGCISLIVLLVEVPVALLLGLASAVRGWGGADERHAAAATDWVPVLWFGGFTLCVAVIAAIFLHSGHPFAAALQLLLAAVSLCFTIAVWQGGDGRAHSYPPTSHTVRSGIVGSTFSAMSSRALSSGRAPDVLHTVMSQ
ncbi:DUF6234 family protein [Streptomyces tendae]|uniref:DUF6234 family protein n=1 Tax=Streptomyces tendae TaxID=1932 RepID=UPI003EC08D0A